MIPYIQSSVETPKKANEASINSHEIKQSEFLGDKIFEKVKLERLMTIILKSITKYIEDLIRNKLLRKKYTLPEKSSDEIYKKEINMLREELKIKDFIIKDLLQTIKEMKTKSVSVQSNTSPMSSSKVNLLPVNNSVAIEDLCNNSDDIADINDEIIIPGKKDINDNFSKTSMQNQLEEVIREKKEKFYELKNCNNKNSEPVATNNKGETQGKYPDGTAIIIGDSILNGIIQERLSRKERVVKVHNFRGATVDDMKHHVIPLLRKEPSFIIIHAGTNNAPYLISLKILNNLITFQSFITDKLSNCKVVISSPTFRTDDGKAALSQFANHLLQLDIDIIDNRNINARNLGNKGLHLNPTCTSRLAKNHLSSLKSF